MFKAVARVATDGNRREPTSDELNALASILSVRAGISPFSVFVFGSAAASSVRCSGAVETFRSRKKKEKSINQHRQATVSMLPVVPVVNNNNSAGRQEKSGRPVRAREREKSRKRRLGASDGSSCK